MSDLHSVLLAAGGSSRLGRAKQLLTLGGSTLVARAAERLLAITPEVTVVTGASAEKVGDVLQDLDLRLVQNPRWRIGIGTSIALAVRDLPESAEAVLLMLCDQYRVTESDLRSLLKVWEENRSQIVASRWAGSFGPPVVFPRRHFKALGRLHGDMGARQLLVQQRTRVRYVSIANAAYDVDDPADLVQFKNYRELLASDSGDCSSK